MSALSTVRVLELAESVVGEYCGKLLADFGAEVVKLERPGTGSPTRRSGPFASLCGVAEQSTEQAVPDSLERSGLFGYLNSGKQSVTVDLEDPDGRHTLEQLLGVVDVVIDDHDGPWLTKLGLDRASCEARRPELVLCSITPYGLSDDGQPQPLAADLNVFHASGWGYHTPTGAEPHTPPLNGAGHYLPSYEAALDGALCVAAALHDKAETGTGRFIDVSMQAVLASRVDYVLGQMVAGDMEVSTDRQAFDLFGPAGIFACADGYVYLWMSAPGHWDALRQMLGAPAWMDDFPDNWLELACTPERVALCRHHVAAWLATQSKSEVSAEGQRLGLTMAPVNNARDLLACPQFDHRGFFAEVDHPVLGKTLHPTVPYRLSDSPARIAGAAPLLDQHAEALAAWLDMPPKETSQQHNSPVGRP